MDFKSMKKNRSALLSEMIEKTKKQEMRNSHADPRFWKPFLDKDKGKGAAIVRFLPKLDTELEWAKVMDHSFKGPGGYLIEGCPTTVGKECPVCDLNTEIWKLGDDSNKKDPFHELVRDRKRALSYISSIVVISDTSRPENNGKVFLWKFGTKVYKKIRSALIPEFEGMDTMNPFDMWEGADFNVRVKYENNFWNYDDSGFSPPSEAFGGDEVVMEAAYNDRYGLAEFENPDSYKSYDELRAQVIRASGSIVSVKDRDDVVDVNKFFKISEAVDKPAEKFTPSAPSDNKKPPAESTPPRASEEPKKETVSDKAPFATDDDDDDIDFFKSLSKG